jgi:hypothetical protein
MADEFCDPGTPGYPKWTALDAMEWKLLPDTFGGGSVHLFDYKDAWVKYNRNRIKMAAASRLIPPLLLGSVAWAEAGGMPDFVKGDVVFPLRSFDWSGPHWVDRYLTITSPPGKTSFGEISIELRVAARELGITLSMLPYSKQQDLARCLETDTFNIDVVARHLHRLILYDYPGIDTAHLTDEQFIVAGSRYNRGTQRALADFIASLTAPEGSPTRQYTEYGRSMIRHRDRVKALLGVGP